jgi:hypothetical protein
VGATGATGGGIALADNGLTLGPGPTVQLGGALNQHTSVTFGGASSFSLSLGDNIGVGSSPNLRLSNTAGIGASQTANTQFGGSVSSAIRTINSNYTLADDDYTVLCNNSAGLGGGVIITPPPASAANRGRIYVIKRVNPNTSGINDSCRVANVDGTSGNVELKGPILGALTTDMTGVTIQSDGTQWWIVGTIMGTIPPRGVQGVATAVVTTTSDVYVGMLDGPDVDAVVPASGQLILILTAEASGNTQSNGDPCSTGYMSVALNGSVALDANSLRVTGNVPNRASITVLITGLTPGVSINFAARYKNADFLGRAAGCGPARFNARQIIVIPN